jgi:BirA family transcriptional regulator, biotin operon repressor / biotin---[acetyl-CoA-carboxylase] ligase
MLESAGSTNDVLAGLVAAGDEPSFSTVLTLDQTAGRGRLGRTWTAPRGKTAAVSVLVRVAEPATFPFGWIPLVAGVAMSTSIDALVGGGRTGLKWPNDVQVDGLKVCGILAELVPTADAVIVGTGINLTLAADELPVPTAISLALAGVALAGGELAGDELVDAVVSRYLAVLDELLTRLETAHGDASGSGIHRVVSEWCRTLGRDVRVLLPDGSELFGEAVGLDNTGRLIVRDGRSNSIAVSAGDVTHLRYE